MFLKSRKFFLYLPALFLNLLFILGFGLICLYTINFEQSIYQDILNDQEFYKALFYGLKVSFFSISTSLGVFLVLYYFLFLLKFKYTKDIKVWLFFLQIPILIPYAFCAFLLFLVFFPTGVLKEFMPFLLGSTYAVVIAYAYKIVPFLILISFPKLLKITKDEINLHKIYSDKNFYFFWKILLKRNLGILFVGLFIVFAYIINAYEIPSILGSNIDKMPAILIYERMGEYSLNSLTIAHASSLIYFGITLVFIPIFYFVYKFLQKVVF